MGKNQPQVMATAQAVQALLAALRGDRQAAAALAAQAERVCVPIGASAAMVGHSYDLAVQNEWLPAGATDDGRTHPEARLRSLIRLVTDLACGASRPARPTAASAR